MAIEGRDNAAATLGLAAPVISRKSSTVNQFETASGVPTSASGSLDPENVFYMSYRVFLEGVEVPVNGIQLDYGVTGIPQCNISLPASKLLRELPPTTKVAVFFRDLVPESDGSFKWRLLFDGEFMGYGYSVSSHGASMSLAFMHNAAHMHSMQLMIMDMSEFWIGGGNQYSAGDSTLVSPQSWNRPEKTILRGLLSEESAPNYKTMADICYTLVRTVLADVRGTASGKYFKTKFGDITKNGLGGYKLLRRFYGISESATKMDIPEEGLIDQDTSGGSSTGNSIGSKKMNSDQPRIEEQPASPTIQHNPISSKIITDRADKLVNRELEKDGFGEEGCARAVNYMITGDKSYPYSEEADVMATRVKSEGGSIFTDPGAVRAGDLVFYANTYGDWEKGTITHVGIADGSGNIVHQGTKDKGVTRVPINYSRIAYYGRLKK